MPERASFIPEMILVRNDVSYIIHGYGVCRHIATECARRERGTWDKVLEAVSVSRYSTAAYGQFNEYQRNIL